jgi:hypothetical protein
MPVRTTYPGVYVEEIPSGVHPIAGVATSVAAFVDAFARGPVDAAVEILGMTDFERVFGGLSADSESSYAIAQFFLNGGSDAWVVRVQGAAAVSAKLTLTDKAVGASGSSNVLELDAGLRVHGVSVENPGEWGNALRAEVDFDTQDPSKLFNLTITEVATRNARVQAVQSEVHRNLSVTAGDVNDAAEKVSEASQLVQAAFPNGVTALPAPSGTLGDALPAALPSIASGKKFKIDITGASPAVATANGTFTYTTAPADYGTVRALLEAAIRSSAAADSAPWLSSAEVHLIGDGSSGNPFRLHVRPGRDGALAQPNTQLTFSGDVANSLNLAGGNSVTNNAMYVLAGGVDDVPTDAEIRGVEASKTGMYALEDADIFNLLCIPEAVAEGVDAATTRRIYSEAEAYCDRKRAFLLIDVPDSVVTLDGMRTWMSNNDVLRDNNAAVYFPRPIAADPLNGNRPKALPASGTIAGIYARTDAARGIWKAPAGTDAGLRGVDDLAFRATDAENGVLNPIGVNVLRRFPVYGIVSWGARTLEGADVLASEWKYVPVRRTALYLEESLFRGLKWVVFEPNDEPLWAQIRLNVGAFMQNLFRQGAFQGTTAREAYFVKCDSATTTQADIDLGIVNILVGFAPLKPAEFVVLRIQQLAGQIET